MIVLSLRDPEGLVAAQPFATKERYGCGVPLAGAISQNNSIYHDFFGESETFLIRLPRRCAPRNDTSEAFLAAPRSPRLLRGFPLKKIVFLTV